MNEANETVPRARIEIKLSPADEARFWSKVDKSAGPDACWLWTAYKCSRGYGQFKLGRRMIKAHRAAWVITNGTIPLCRISACHKCDNPPCCNPAHLFLGTQKDNADDMEKKGRGKHIKGDSHYSRIQPERLARGESNGWAKLVASQVLEIRSLYATGTTTQTAIAERFGVSQGTIGQIINRKNWKHI